MNETVTSTNHACRKLLIPSSQVLVWTDVVQCDNAATYSFWHVAEKQYWLSRDLSYWNVKRLSQWWFRSSASGSWVPKISREKIELNSKDKVPKRDSCLAFLKMKWCAVWNPCMWKRKKNKTQPNNKTNNNNKHLRMGHYKIPATLISYKEAHIWVSAISQWGAIKHLVRPSRQLFHLKDPANVINLEWETQVSCK